MSRTTLIAAAALSLITAASSAEAGSRRYSATACTFETDYAGDYVFVQGVGNASAGLGSRSRVLHCPILDRDDEKATLGGIGINGADGNNETSDGNVAVRACESQWFGGVSCSAWRDVSNGSAVPSATYTGLVNEWLPASLVSVIRNTAATGGYAELLIKLPRQGVFGVSQVFGYSTVF